MTTAGVRVPSTTIALPMDLTIACVQALRMQLADALLLERPLELDARAVDRCDTAGLQLLLAVRLAAAATQPVLVTEAPESMLHAAAALGLTTPLGLTPLETIPHA